MDSIISLKNVSKVYKLYASHKDRLKEVFSYKKIYHKKFKALENINLEITSGEIIGIVGANGSGKSTLLKLISNILVPSEGQISIRGEVTPLIELGAGFNPEFTGVENIYFYGAMNGIHKKDLHEYMNNIVAFAEIKDFINQPLKTYSSGMIARLAFAVSTVLNPEILILDEILSVGDIAFKRKSFLKIEEFFKKGKTIIIVSHNTDTILKVCTRAILINDGKFIIDSLPKIVMPLYEKLTYAKPDRKKIVLQEIERVNEERKDYNKRETQSIESNKKDTRKGHLELALLNNIYIEEFISKTKSIKKRKGIELDDYFLKDKNNEKVNRLVFGEEYSLSLNLHFEQNINELRFIILFKDMKGIAISSTHHYSKDFGYFSFQKDTSVLIDLQFKNLLLPNHYYIDFVVGELNDIGRYPNIFTSLDLLLFNVQEFAGRDLYGYVNMNQEFNINVES